MHRPIATALVFGLWGCATEAPEALTKRCAPPNYLAHADISGPWHYRSTVLEAGPFEGQGTLQRGVLQVIDDRLHLMVEGTSAASWPVLRRIDVQCVDGAPQAVASNEGAYLDVQWATETESRQVLLAHDGVAAFEPAAAPKFNQAGSGFELTERGDLTVDAGTCDRAEQALGERVPCRHRALLRQALSPVRNPGFTPRLSHGTFGANTRGMHAARAHGVPTYYLPPEAPPDLVAAAQDAAEQIRTVLPGFEILANQCSVEEVQTVLARTGIAAVSGPLSEQCDALQRVAPDEFQWQRPGSVQFNTISLASSSEAVGWGTYAAAAVDPSTAEIVAVDLFVDLNDLNHIADRVRAAAAHSGFAPPL